MPVNVFPNRPTSTKSAPSVHQSNSVPKELALSLGSRRGISVGIDISIDAIEITAFSEFPQRVLVDWSEPTGLLPTESSEGLPPDQWVDHVCERLESMLPQLVAPRNHVALVSLPTSWFHFQTESSDTALESELNQISHRSPFGGDAAFTTWTIGEPKRTISNGVTSQDAQQVMVAAISADAASKICHTLRRSGYRVEGLIPDSLAVALASQAATGLESPCVVTLHRDGGCVTLVRDGQVLLCRSLPPIVSLKDAAAELTESQMERWLQTVADEIQATLNYGNRLARSSETLQPIAIDTPVLIAGTIAQKQGVAETLAGHLQLPVARWQSTGTYSHSTESCWTIADDSADSGESDSENESTRAGAVSLAMLANASKPHRQQRLSNGRKPDTDSQSIEQTSRLSQWRNYDVLPVQFHLQMQLSEIRSRWTSIAVLAAFATFLIGLETYASQYVGIQRTKMVAEKVEPIRRLATKLNRVEKRYQETLELCEQLHQHRPTDSSLQSLGAIAEAAAATSFRIQLDQASFDFQDATIQLAGRVASPSDARAFAESLAATGWVQLDSDLAASKIKDDGWFEWSSKLLEPLAVETPAEWGGQP